MSPEDSLVQRLDAISGTAKQLREENDRLRAALANSDRPCVYCTLSAEDWNKCQSGFPGCARADDAVGCPELGAMLRERELYELLKPMLAAFDTWLSEQQAFRARYFSKAAAAEGPEATSSVLVPLPAGLFYDLKKIMGSK